jgi:hypothetical protein
MVEKRWIILLAQWEQGKSRSAKLIRLDRLDDPYGKPNTGR